VLRANRWIWAAITMPVRNVSEIERAIPAFAAEPGGGLIVVPPTPAAAEREVINRLAAQNRLPVIYQDRSFVTPRRARAPPDA
jgi:hypothetical protein